MIQPDKLLAILDEPLGSPKLEEVLSKIQPPSETSKDPELGQTWYGSPGGGINILHQNGGVEAIHLYSTMSDAVGSWVQYQYPLPHGLAFGDDKESVTARFENPVVDRRFFSIYRLETHGIRIGYKDDKLLTLNLISLKSSILKV